MAPVTPLRDTFNDSLNKGASPPCIFPTAEGSLFGRFRFQDLISASLTQWPKRRV